MLCEESTLVSDPMVEAAARAMNLEAGRQRGLAFEDDWETLTEQERGGWRLVAKAGLDAALSIEPEIPNLDVLHLLNTVMDYGPASARSLTDLYNSECKYDEFDPLPIRSVRSIAGSLAVLRTEGLVESFHHSDPVEWGITDAGRDVANSFVGAEARG